MPDPSDASSRDLEGDVAVVTGAGRGFGRSVAERLAGAGATVALIARTVSELEEVADSITRSGGRATPFALDVTNRRAVEAAFAQIDERWGGASLLVNNAGTLNGIGPFWDIDPDDWWREVEVHLRGAALCCNVALKRMVPRGRGRIINIGGLLGQFGEPYSTAYTSAKAALYRLTECLASELRKTGVRVFCMSPGPVRTRLTEALVEGAEGRLWLPEFSQLGDDGWVPAETGAELVLRLARGDADGLAGKALHVQDDLDALIEQGDRLSSERFVMRISS